MAFVRKYTEDSRFREKVGKMPDFSSESLVEQETLIGVVNGVNRLFKMRSRPFIGSESIYKDGMLMKRATSLEFKDGDYYLNYSNREVTFSHAQTPQERAVILCSYRYY